MKTPKKKQKKLGVQCERAIHQIDRLLHRKAHDAWRRLPTSVQFWIDEEDLYQEALIVAMKCWRVWDPERTKFITLVFTAVDNRLNTIVSWWRSRKHYAGTQVELEVVDWETRVSRQMDLTVDGAIALVVEQMEAADAVVWAFGRRGVLL